jgi:hypothetical protein
MCSLAVGVAFAEESQSISAPVPIGSVDVAYPAEARGDAEVELELLIAEDGTVSRSTVRSGPPSFAEAARARAEGFRFKPATRNGIPVRARIAFRVVFREPKPEPVTPPPRSDPSEAAPKSPSQEEGAAAPVLGAEEPVEVVVLGEQRAELGSIRIPKEEARRVPGAFGDPFRVVEVLPGVAPVLSGLPYFYVRGAPPGDVGYSIDGIRVPLLFHVGPGPSVIAPAMVERVDLFPGAYPVRFGRYAGAVLAGETSPPSERSRAEGQARIFDASAMLEQPFAGGRGSALVGGRYSYMQPILAAVAPEYELRYGDYQARLNYAAATDHRLTLFAFGGYDFLRNQELRATLFDVEFHRVDLRWDHVHEHGRLRLAATLSSDRVLASPEDEGGSGSRQESRGIRGRAEIEQDLGSAVRWRAGGDFGAERIQNEREQVEDFVRTYPDRTDLTGGAWTDLVWRPARGVEIVPGARVDILRSRGERHIFLEPRLSTRTRLTQGLAYLAGFGLAHQLPAMTVRMPGRRPSLLERSEQAATQTYQGLEYALPDGMLGRTTLFHQFMDIDVSGVRGRSYGLEQFLRRDFTRRLGGFLSYTLSRAEGEAAGSSVLSSFDRTHVVSGVLGYDFGAGYRFGVRGYFATGRAYPVACPTPDCGPGNPQAPYVYERVVRLPEFFRLDLRFEKRWQFPSGFWLTGTVEWFNALLASEVEDAHYTPQGIVFDEQSPLTLPSIGVELGW